MSQATLTQATPKTSGGPLYILHRVAILLACAAVFYPGFNPGRITSAISRNVSLFTASQIAMPIFRRIEKGEAPDEEFEITSDLYIENMSPLGGLMILMTK